MSPLSLRRHRAERLLREQFEELRGRVLASVRGRLRASGASLDDADLDACYAQAWQGLYMAILDGQEIANPAGWLVLVTHRRAIDEHRARTRSRGGDSHPEPAARVAAAEHAHAPHLGAANAGAPLDVDALAAAERDLAAELDDRVRLRQLFEGLRGRLDAREREAATLCYLQGLSRADAAARMGVSEPRMRKLMEGRGPGRPGVAAKMGELVASIREDGWCKEQGSLMRALAYGVLDPDGERYQLALMHSSQCPSCRAYVVSLRGLAATLPPVLLPGGLAAAVLAYVGGAGHVVATGAGGAATSVAGGGTAAGAGGSAAGAVVQVGRRLGGGLSPPGAGAAGAGAAGGAVAGGGWLFASGPMGAKLAVGCLLALGVGAGCLALEGQLSLAGRAPARRAIAPRGGVSSAHHEVLQLALPAGEIAGALAQPASGAHVEAAVTHPANASREFGLESLDQREEPVSSSNAGRVSARASASAGPDAHHGSGLASNPQASTPEASGAGSTGQTDESSGAYVGGQPSVGQDSVAVEREFAPG